MSARDDFAQMAAREDDAIEIDRGALLIAAEEYPDLWMDEYLDKLDLLAHRVQSLLYTDAGPHETLARLNQVLFEEEGFRGDNKEYYDPRNSYLNEVVDRRIGIPITLSALYGEVARRVGFRLEGVGFPGHFLLKHEMEQGEILVDPFDRGKILTHDDCRAKLKESFQGKLEFHPHQLARTSPRQMLLRVLGNLKSIYVNRRDHPRALAAVERMLLLVSDSPPEIRDRGILLSGVGRPLEGVGELARYLRLKPDAGDRERVESIMDRLRLQIGMAN
ncbi:MAG TPA: transglutaminase-like domain-containing protein [Vicinamibacteria bacterium]